MKKFVGNYDNVKNYDYIFAHLQGVVVLMSSALSPLMSSVLDALLYIESSLCIFVGSSGPHEQCSISSDVLSPRCCGSNNSDNAPRRLLKVDFFLMKLIKPDIQSLY